ncbi:MAG TPA: hypothetical protein VJR90_01600 [Gammaproteobacteria bacterium]|nr:hypothetical protein [Gammaproteobacteria bacterium]
MTTGGNTPTTCVHCGAHTVPGSRCAQCGASPGAPVARKLLASGTTSADHGIFLLATPVLAAVALLAVALATHSTVGLVLVLVLMVLVCGAFAASEIFQSPAAWDSGRPMQTMLGWLALVTLLWPAGYPAYLRTRRRWQLGNWLAGALVVELVLIAGVVLAAVIIQTGYAKPTAAQVAAEQRQNQGLLAADPRWMPDAGDIPLVKSSYLDNCKQRTVEQEVNAFLAAPRWEAGADSRGRDFVNIHGGVTYNGRPTAAVFQFLIDKDKRGFKYHAFTINGVPQTIYVAALTLMEMCASANRAPMTLTPRDRGAR